MDEHFNARIVTFDFNFRNAGKLEVFFEIFSDVIVGNECIAENFVFSEPSRVPIFDYTNTETVRINFLTHFD